MRVKRLSPSWMFACELVSVGLFAAALGMTVGSFWGTSPQVLVAVWLNEQCVKSHLTSGGRARWCWRQSGGYLDCCLWLLRALRYVVRRGRWKYVCLQNLQRTVFPHPINSYSAGLSGTNVRYECRRSDHAAWFRGTHHFLFRNPNWFSVVLLRLV
jgi:hypothetical protein